MLHSLKIHFKTSAAAPDLIEQANGIENLSLVCMSETLRFSNANNIGDHILESTLEVPEPSAFMVIGRLTGM